MRVLVAGGEGQLGREFLALASNTVEIICCARMDLDITDLASIARALDVHQPDAIVNAAAYTAVDRAETDRERAFSVNADGAGNLARAANGAGIPLVHVSTDYVFSGDRPLGLAYRECDPCHPHTVYGASKLAGEQQVLAVGGDAFVLRTSWVFGCFGGNFPKTIMRLARERDALRVVSDQWGCPTFATDIATSIMALLDAAGRKQVPGRLFHYAGSVACSWFDFADHVLDEALHMRLLARKPILSPIMTVEYPVPAPRPHNSVLDCSRLLSEVPAVVLSDWKSGIKTLLASGNF